METKIQYLNQYYKPMERLRMVDLDIFHQISIANKLYSMN